MANKDNLVFGLDIGTRSIVGVVGYKDSKEGFNILALCSRLHEERAMLDGQIHNIDAVSEKILEVKLNLEKKLQTSLNEVCIAAAGRVLKTSSAKSEYIFDEETNVTLEHINSLELMAVENAYDLLKKNDKDALSYYCVSYTNLEYKLNDYKIKTLLGHKAKKIETELIATFLPYDVINGLYIAVEKAGLTVSNLTLEPMAAIEVAIPEKFRLLNIALVDIGAGTSDICITKDGVISAYGMIPLAGDELTEQIVQRYLVDFNTADKMKIHSTFKKTVHFQDALGLSHNIKSLEIQELIEPMVDSLAKQISEKILELNNNKAVSAVFIVGGGGRVNGFTEKIATYLSLQKERVAIRGSDVLSNVKIKDEKVRKDSLLITPVGICLNYYSDKNNFIMVSVNKKRVKLYDNNRLTVVDAAIASEISYTMLFPKRGDSLNYIVNNKTYFVKGETGEAAIIKINGENATMNTKINKNDEIEIIESTKGDTPKKYLYEISEYNSSIRIIVNKTPIDCPVIALVNGNYQSKYYEIQNDDNIKILDYYTIDKLLEFMDIKAKGDIFINNTYMVSSDEKIYANFSVDFEVVDKPLEETKKIEHNNLEKINENILNDVDVELEQKKKEIDSILKGEKVHTSWETSREWENDRIVEDKVEVDKGYIDVTINGLSIKLFKKSPTVIDAIDEIKFNLDYMKNHKLSIKVNGNEEGVVFGIKDGDDIVVEWIKVE